MNITFSSLFNFLLAEADQKPDKSSFSERRAEHQLSDDDSVDVSISTGKFCKDLGEIERRISEWKQKYVTSAVSRFEVNKTGGAKALNVEISPASGAPLSEFLAYFDSLEYYLNSDQPCIPKGYISATVHIPIWPQNTIYAKQVKDVIASAFKQDHVSASVKTVADKDLTMKIDDTAIDPASLKMNGVVFAPPRQTDDFLGMAGVDSDYQMLAKKITEKMKRKLDDYRVMVVFERPLDYYSVVDKNGERIDKDEWKGGEAPVERRVAQEFAFRLGMHIRDTRLKMILGMSSFIKKVREKINPSDPQMQGRLTQMESQINDLWRQVDTVTMTQHPKSFDTAVLKMNAEVGALAETAKKMVLKMDAEARVQGKEADRKALLQMSAEARALVEEAKKSEGQIKEKDQETGEEDTGDELFYDKIHLFPWDVVSFSLVSPKDRVDSIKKPYVTVMLVPKSLNLAGFKKHGFKALQEATSSADFMSDFYAQIRKDAVWQMTALPVAAPEASDSTVSNPDN